MLGTKAVGQVAGRERGPLGLVWVDCPDSLPYAGLGGALEAYVVRLHWGRKPPEEVPSAVVCYAESGEDVALEVSYLRAAAPGAAVVVLGPSADPCLARAALSAGARGFIHTGMGPEQIVRALSVAVRGEVVLPRELLEGLVAEERPPDLSTLRPRQLEILELVAQGLSNAQVAGQLFLSESTVKQHLRAAYKALGVKNRNQAAVLFRRNNARRNNAAGGVVPPDLPRERREGGAGRLSVV